MLVNQHFPKKFCSGAFVFFLIFFSSGGFNIFNKVSGRCWGPGGASIHPASSEAKFTFLLCSQSIPQHFSYGNGVKEIFSSHFYEMLLLKTGHVVEPETWRWLVVDALGSADDLRENDFPAETKPVSLLPWKKGPVFWTKKKHLPSNGIFRGKLAVLRGYRYPPRNSHIPGKG